MWPIKKTKAGLPGSQNSYIVNYWFWEFSVNWLSLIVPFPFTLCLLANHHGSTLKNTDLDSLFTEIGDILTVSEDAVGKIKL